MPLFDTPAEIDEPRPDMDRDVFALDAAADEFAYEADAARRAAILHEQAGPDEAAL